MPWTRNGTKSDERKQPWTQNGTKFKLGRSGTEAENEFGRTLYCNGHETEQKLKFGRGVGEAWRKRGGSVVKRPPSVDTKRNKFEVCWKHNGSGK